MNERFISVSVKVSYLTLSARTVEILLGNPLYFIGTLLYFGISLGPKDIELNIVPTFIKSVSGVFILFLFKGKHFKNIKPTAFVIHSACITGVILFVLRFSGERRQARSERGAREEKGCFVLGFFSLNLGLQRKGALRVCECLK